MRMRKLKWAKDHLEQSQVLITNPSEISGTWNEVLKSDRIQVEVGSGKGDYWTKMAAMYPEIGFIGVEKNESAAALSTRKYEDNPLSNMKFIYQDAKDIDTWFKSGEVDVIHLNFSDPWPKKRTQKRRLSDSSFIQKYEKILKDDGRIIMKSDNAALFEFTLQEFSRLNWLIQEVWVDFRSQEHDEDAISEYEQRFMEKGQPIYRVIFQKRHSE
ncbi:MAG: tRNA (guanosine(46)-N7)-methyltransferase TrmB [Erysipelotrichaceae bacterium]